MRIFTGELPYSRLTLLRRDEVCELEKFCKFEPYAGAGGKQNSVGITHVIKPTRLRALCNASIHVLLPSQRGVRTLDRAIQTGENCQACIDDLILVRASSE